MGARGNTSLEVREHFKENLLAVEMSEFLLTKCGKEMGFTL